MVGRAILLNALSALPLHACCVHRLLSTTLPRLLTCSKSMLDTVKINMQPIMQAYITVFHFCDIDAL